jgi:hypothetical protein
VTIESFTAEAASTLAGAHADVTTAFSFRTINNDRGSRPFGGDVADLNFTLPAGLVGNVQNTPECLGAQFSVAGIEPGCPADTQVGVAEVDFALRFFGGAPVHRIFGVYNLQPAPDEPARLGIEGTVVGAPVLAPILISASAANHYAITASAPEAEKFPIEAFLLGAKVTLWGVPNAHQRASGVSVSSPAGEANGETREVGVIPPDPPALLEPLMENPTDCTTTPATALFVNTLEAPEVFSSATADSATPSDCVGVPFAPSIKIEPDTAVAGAPVGLNFTLAVPQSNDPAGRGSSQLRTAEVTLPQGTTISPSAASKPLEACTDTQFAALSDAAASCPAASVIGRDEVDTPLLAGPLTGDVYLGQPLSTDPRSGQMYRVFLELQGFGLDVKLQGSVTADSTTGQLTATFTDLPEVPFEQVHVNFTGGPNAVLVNPQSCGSQTTTTQLYPYSNPGAPATPSSSFLTSYAGAPCPAVLPFAPSAAISTSSPQAGATSPMTVSFARADETQPLGQIDATLPSGLLGYVAKVPLCESSTALAGGCGPESRIGTVTTSAGAGPDPLNVQGPVYLARGSNGYPFMLSVVVPAVAGPYDLGNVVVPVWLQVNSDGSITAVSGPLPSILDGIPLDIRAVTMTLDRPGFMFNPTSCAPLAMTGSITSLAGAVAGISAPFQAAGCASLPFAPAFTVATAGKTSKANGASLTVRVAQKPGEADIQSVHVELPKQLPSRLSTLNKACTEAQFNANPAGCPKGSIVGTAIALTPTLSARLSGPAILVSHGGAAFPDLEIVLQGEGVTVVLDGKTNIKHGVTSSTFESVPDVPISGFELTLPEGPYSLLTPNATLCTSKLLMPTTILGHNGSTVKQNTRIAVTSCPKTKATSKRKTHAKKAIS